MPLSYRKRTANEKICWIVLHYTGTPDSTAMKTVKSLKNSSRAVSTHYVCDDDGVCTCVPDVNKNAAYHCGGKETSKNGCYNGNAIGVDICERKTCTKTCSVNDCDWFFTLNSMKNAARLVGRLMYEYNIDLDHVVRHYDVTGKVCPRPFVGDDPSGSFNGMTCNEAWEMFKKWCKVYCDSICELKQFENATIHRT